MLSRVLEILADVVDGTKSNENSRYRSASHDQSPTRLATSLHPGLSSVSNIPRSSSDTNLVMDTEKKGTRLFSPHVTEQLTEDTYLDL